MNDLSTGDRLEKLRTLEAWLDWQLKQTCARIRTLEAELERERRQQQRAREETSWKLQPDRARKRVSTLHRGGCTMWKSEMGYLSREDVLLALDDDTMTIEMCGICRPETGLRTPDDQPHINRIVDQ
ncbi:DUF6233 domain-containing protein [Streptomyces sp. NPDC051104]|uniref:DUF6233 domain-containing protein n=1 Tax=Streptomyces sp. NPDC051104 TaxID=3155044 RepID=UPI00343F8A21